MSLLLPEAGLLFWMLLAFGIVFVILRKYGFPVITSMIDERKKFIDDALKNAKEANEKLAAIEKQAKDMLNRANEEQARILHEAAVMRDHIIGDARHQAEKEGAELMAETRRQIQMEKEAALREIRAEVAGISIAIAEKVLRSELSDKEKQQEYATDLASEVLGKKSDEK